MWQPWPSADSLRQSPRDRNQTTQNFYDAEEYHQKYLDKNPEATAAVPEWKMEMGYSQRSGAGLQKIQKDSEDLVSLSLQMPVFLEI